MQRYNFFCTFENFFVLLQQIMPIMKRIYLCWLCLFLVLSVRATDYVTLTLQGGMTFSGELLVENDDVIVLRDKQGRRFQYMKSEIAMFSRLDRAPITVEKETQTARPGKVAVRFQVAAGAATLPHVWWGTDMAADFMLGTRTLADRSVFLGGSVGYHGVFLPEQRYHYVPIQLVLSMPLVEGKHAPELGLSVGYGISANTTQGGLCASAKIGYRYTFSPRGALLLSAYLRFQQDRLTIQETMEGKLYDKDVGSGILGMGIHMALQF